MKGDMEKEREGGRKESREGEKEREKFWEEKLKGRGRVMFCKQLGHLRR